MNPPSREAAAYAAARYVTGEFTTFSSWFSYENELAAEWLKQPSFVCGLDYAIGRVMTLIRHNRSMQTTAAHGGVAEVVGRVVGEWVTGHTTIDRELETW